ncbi:MAG: ATP-dependent zinc metalloprotease FtsH [Candidatus Portnoybacteria bacterium]|nr:ATP-dependent zinc metalloprotease FtsH [Candidatus Portnoybacteria bacterium]
MKNLFKNLVIIILIFLAVSAIFSFFSEKNQKPEKITLSELANRINQEKIDKISVNGQEVSVKLKDGTNAVNQKETEAGLIESLKNLDADTGKLQSVPIEIVSTSTLKYLLISLLPYLIPLLIMGLFLWLMFRQARQGATQAFGFTRSLVRMLTPQDKKQKTTFKDVAGLKEAKEELQEVVEFLKFPAKFKAVGARIPKGVILIGPPGTGKTLLARAVSGEANVPFFHISGSEFVELFVGVGASRVRDTFAQAKKSAPAILFIDELDAIGRHRGAGLGGGHDEREQTLNQILVEMDGFEPDTQVIILAATNRPDILDPALLRPGRFDRRVVLDLPDIGDRVEILKIHSEGKPIEKKVDFRQIAERTPGFSGADLSNLMNEAAILTAKKNLAKMSMEELIPSIEKVLLGPERKSLVFSEKEKKIAAYHEAAHALVNTSLPNTDVVRKISIISRGRAAGYTLKLPTEDKHLRTKTEFVEELAVLLAGYTVEKIVFNELTTGASNDLEQATKLAQRLVMRYGMSEKMGARTFGEQEEMIFLGKEIVTEKDYSDKVAAQIDEEVSKFIETAQKTAHEILTAKRPLLDKLANRLLEKETIEKEEFEKIIKEEE